MKYLHWDEKTLTDFSADTVAGMYGLGYLFTRLGKGVMQQTRSVRIRLNHFQTTSENRRILKKTEGVELAALELPIKNYDWPVGKMAKDFYDTKFGKGIMSAQKMKEILTEPDKSNFNLLLSFTSKTGEIIGYAACRTAKGLLHYSYPFYDLKKSPHDMGLGMMVRAIDYAKSKGMDFVYIGSLQRPADIYKLQFEGLEWFDGKNWKKDIEEAKSVLRSSAKNNEK